MTEAPVLRDLVVLFAAALPIVLVFQQLRVPTVVGFLSAGVLIGPDGLGLIAHGSDVERLAEIGLVLLLFVIGLELSMSHVLRMGRNAILAGVLQVAVTGALGAALAAAFGWTAAHATVIGFLLVHSSTAIVFKVLGDRGELHAPHGRIAVATLLIQDLSLVPMMLVLGLLAAPAEASWAAVGAVLLKAAAAVFGIIVAARLLMPMLLRRIVRLRSRELFTAAMVFLCLGTAWAASRLGLSLAIGALLAGLVISESEYSHQAVADVLPFRDAFNSIFFISMGMLLSVRFLTDHLALVLAAAAAAMLFRVLVLAAVVVSVYRSARVAGIAALTLAGVGEVSFVVARAALPAGLMTTHQYEFFVAIAVVTMVAGTFLIGAAEPATALLLRRLGRAESPLEAPAARPAQVVIVGYGLNGENLAHVLRQTGLAYVILELDPARVATAQRRNEPVHYGDATRIEVLRRAGVATAQVIVVAISDPVATRRIVSLVRQLQAEVPVIVRTRYVSEIEELNSLGATEVIPEEFETSVEIFARVLRRLRVPRNVINLQVQLIRRQGYGMLRAPEVPRQTLGQLDDILAATTTETFLVQSSSPAVGSTIADLKLRRETGVTIIAIVRNGTPTTNPPSEWEIRGGDILVLVGNHAQLDQALTRLGEDAEDEP